MSLTSKQIDELRAYAKDRKGELAKLINDAADTIEMLSAKLHASQMERSSQYYHGGWIPCQERLPETGERVLITCEIRGLYGRKSRYVCKGYHVNRYEMESDGDWDEGSDEYKEDDDKYYVLEGWYETIHNWGDYGSVFIDDFVLAWMPLPEPYREEGEQDG